MRKYHYIKMRVFCYEEDSEDKITEKIKELFPLDFEKEKIKLESKTAYGFEDKKIKILTVVVKREKHCLKVMENLVKNLNEDQKQLLLKQMDSRLDENLLFYLRLEKDKLLDGEYRITDSGNCFHFKIAVAAFPHKREIAEGILRGFFG